MILEPKTVGLILTEKRTMLRRPVDASDPRYRTPRTKNGAPKRGQSRQLQTPWTPRVGDVIPIQDRVRENGVERLVTACRVKVTDHRQERHGAISLLDALAEGARTTVAYKARWVRWHDRVWIGQLKDGIDALDDEQLVPRFDARWGERQVYVISFKLERLESRFLAADPAAQQTDYVTSASRAMKGEGAPVPEGVQQQYAKEGLEKPRVTKREVWGEARVAIEDQIERLKASGMGRDVGATLRRLERELEVLDRKIDQAA